MGAAGAATLPVHKPSRPRAWCRPTPPQVRLGMYAPKFKPVELATVKKVGCALARSSHRTGPVPRTTFFLCFPDVPPPMAPSLDPRPRPTHDSTMGRKRMKRMADEAEGGEQRV